MNSTISNQNIIEGSQANQPQIVISWHHQPNSQGPFLKNHSAVLFDRSMVIFGGYDGELDKNALWLYSIDSDTWTLQKYSGDKLIKPRNGHSATLVGKQVYIIGGWLGIGPYASDEMFTLDLDEMKVKQFILKDNESIGPSNMHTCDYYDDHLILFRGGNGINFLNDLVFINIKNKSLDSLITTGKPPCARANHGSCIVKSNLYLFGGWNGMCLLNDLYILNLEIKEWSKVDTALHSEVIPQKRAGAPLVNYRDEFLVLFGGSCFNSLYLNDVFFYHIESREWKKASLADSSEAYPPERAGHSVIFNGEKLIIFGGGNSMTYLNAVTVLQVNPPPVIHLKNHFDDEEALQAMFNNPFLSDLVLIVEGKKIYCHFIILASFSPKFREVYHAKSKELIDNKAAVELEVGKYKYDNVLLVINYCYTGTFEGYSKKMDNLIELLLISDYYGLNRVRDTCLEAITKEMSVESFGVIVKVSKLINSAHLINYCEWFYRQHKQSINNLMMKSSK